MFVATTGNLLGACTTYWLGRGAVTVASPTSARVRRADALVARYGYFADTINVAPGERYDVIWRALQPGKWLIHCHIGHHATNNNVETQGGGGLMMIINVSN